MCFRSGSGENGFCRVQIQPYQTATITDGKKREVSPLERRYAEMQLASSDYRMKQLRSGLGQTGAIEEVLRDCNR